MAQATRQAGVRRHLIAMSRFIGSGLAQFIADSHGVYQYASQQVSTHPAYIMFERLLENELPKKVSVRLLITYTPVNHSLSEKQTFVQPMNELSIISFHSIIYICGFSSYFMHTYFNSDPKMR